MEVWVSRGLPQRLWVQQTWVWHNYQGLGEQTLGGHKQNLVCTRTQEKGAMTPQEIDPDLPMSVQESPAEAWVSSGLLQGSGL